MMQANAVSLPDESAALAMGRRRTWRFLVLFSVWAVVIVARLFQVMVVERGRHVSDMDRSSWRHGMVPGIRGRILDADGVPLAWSERRFALLWTRPADPQEAARQWAALHEAMPLEPRWSLRTAVARAAEEVRLIDAVTPEQFARLGDVCTRHPAFRLEAYFVRQTYPAAALRRELGAVTRRNGMEIGVSGLERVHDSLLRGRPGMYRVMVNPLRAWVPETWEQLRDMTPGYDVYLPIRTTPPVPAAVTVESPSQPQTR